VELCLRLAFRIGFTAFIRVAKQRVGKFEYSELAAVFFLQMMGTGTWLVPLSRILSANGYSTLAPYAYAASAAAAFISPLVFGAMADRHASPVAVLRLIATGSAAGVALASFAIGQHWPRGVILALIQVYAVFAVPTNGIASTIVFSRLRDSQRQFGPVRSWGTFGWMCGCWLISLLNLDVSPRAGYVGALVWITLAAFTFALPDVPPPAPGPVRLRERMGWDALVLLKHHDHGVVFLTAALFSIPLAAFYPFTPPQLQQLGLQHTAAWMSLGQITEMLAMFCLAGLIVHWRLKWIFSTGLAVCVLRYSLCATNIRPWVLAGVTLHGLSFTLFFITAQIYLNERVEHVWRARAQSLMSLMTSGVGNLVGYLGTGWWFQACRSETRMGWQIFWGGLALVVASVLVVFLKAYHGRGRAAGEPESSK
jgi:MFS family permease